MEYQTLGEAAFIAQVNRRAVEYVRAYPGSFVYNSLHRAVLFWIYPVNFWPLSVVIDLGALAGLIVAFRTARAMALQLLAVLAAYPLINCASLIMSRYRDPIDPVLYALAGIALSSVSLKRR